MYIKMNKKQQRKFSTYGAPASGWGNVLPTYTSDIFIDFLNLPWMTVCISRFDDPPLLKYFECDVGSSDFALRKRSNILPLISIHM